ncbi:hypothetical protein M9R32_05490 [Paenisporosarcina quisquiliarum]|uniref:Peptidase M14 domain-containing protein n=1 Tax=Paenisporosarcina quisquiliarum TaxID=365346 RepID=A0A9X3LFT5_9BACL|nr:M14 family zinc carboxypeptidase [Paenisporosarcina quisquiliarum]MCZ8536635.1 hypothetical protein [Paenisporosarcina quisquiliarum]
MKKSLLLFLFLIGISLSIPQQSSANDPILHGQLTSDQVPLYSTIEMTNAVGNLEGASNTVQYQLTQNSSIVQVSIGGKIFFIESRFLAPANKVLPDVESGTERQITSKSSFTIFGQKSSTSNVLVRGNSALSFTTIGYENGFFKVLVAGKIGYFPGNDDNISFSKPAMSIQVIDTKVPLYEIRNGNRVQVGAVASGYIFNREKEVTGYHQFVAKGKTYQIPLKGTWPSSTSAIIKPAAKPMFPASVRVEQETAVTNSTGQTIGYLSRGNMLTLHNFSKDKGVIEFLGSIAYLPLKNVTHSNLVQPKKNISHREMSYWMQVVAGMYPEFTKLELIGKSVEGRAIYALRVGNGKKEILFDASMHAREHMTTNVLLEMIDNYSIHYNNKTSFAGYNVKTVLDQTSIWFVPMMNPDGVTLVQGGQGAVKNGALARKINGSSNFARWKANVRGVDLNKNFDAGWSYINNNITKPNWMGYRGPRAFSEPEAVALKHFVEKHNFMSNVSYHSSGQVLYWFNFQAGAQLSRDVQYVNQLKSITGYSIVPPYYRKGTGSSADWFIKVTKMPGVTVEIAPYAGEAPVPISYWDRIWKQNHKVGLHAANEAWKRK